jgi:hypothetical protein
MKIYPVGANCSIRTDGRMDGQTYRQTHDEAKSRLSQYCELP